MPNLSPYAQNPFGIEVKPLDYTVADAPTTKTYHGASIVVGGNIIGRITSWQPSGAYTREGNHVYELSHATWGRPVDYVPGRSTGYTIALVRTEVWGAELELTLGFAQLWNDLSDQDRPFTVQEYLYRGSALYRVWEYKGCWFQDRNEDAQTADGDGIFKVNGTLAYVQRVRTT
jgi:hypothetical protein